MIGLGKNRAQRAIDQTPETTGGGAIASAVDNDAPPAAPTPNAPAAPALTTGLSQADRSATAYINAYWDAPTGTDPTGYLVQIATDSAFTANVAGYTVARPIDPSVNPSAYLGGLKPNTAYWVRVAARYYSATSAYGASSTITTQQDTTPPGPVTGAAATWSANGDLRLTFAPPNDANYWRTRITIRKDTGAGLLVLTDYAVGGAYVFSQEQNRLLAGLYPILWVEFVTQSYAGYVQAAGIVTLTTTKSKPANISGIAHSWSGDTGAAAADWRITCSLASGANRYRWTVDGTTYETSVPEYSYPLALNRSQHSGAPDPVLSYSVVGVDGLDQLSAIATTGTATNAAPAAPASVTVAGYLGVLAIGITATPPADWTSYRVRVIQTLPAAADVTFDTTTTLLTRAIDTPATYQIGVRIFDVFGQLGSETLSTTTVADALTPAQLRAETEYIDSVGYGATSLAVLKDGVLGGTSGSVSLNYNPLGAWYWTQAQRPQFDRYRTVTASFETSSAAQCYVAYSKDGTTWSYYAGPIAADGRTMTPYALQATAQVNGIYIPPSSYNNLRLDTPVLVEARFVRLYHTANTSYNLHEFYPRRLVQTDDMEAESVKATNIAAGAVTAAKINVGQLSAITADMGSLTAGTITGALIRTAASGARVELNSAGILGTDGAVTQWQALNTDGTLKWGGSAGQLSSAGMRLISGVTVPAYNVDTTQRITWADSLASTAVRSTIGTYNDGLNNMVTDIVGLKNGTINTVVALVARTTSDTAAIRAGTSGAATTYIALDATSVSIARSGGDTTISSGLNVGTASGAAAGEVRASGGASVPRSGGAALFGLDAAQLGAALALSNGGSTLSITGGNNFAGMFMINDTISGACAMFLTGGGVVVKIADTGNNFTTTALTASKYNVYLSSLVVTVENRTAAAGSLNVFILRTRTQN